MRIHHDGYPEGTDLKHFDGGEGQRVKATGVLGFGFKCPCCEGDIFIKHDDFDVDWSDYQCEHCDNLLKLVL